MESYRNHPYTTMESHRNHYHYGITQKPYSHRNSMWIMPHNKTKFIFIIFNFLYLTIIISIFTNS
eukprot:UN11245